MSAAQRIATLCATLHQANHDYYVLSAPSITDAEYDRLFHELKALERDNPDLCDPNSPTCRVGAGEISSFTKVQHSVAMLSLDNTFNLNELCAFFNDTCYRMHVEWKVDGLSLALRYEKGRLVRAITRGDGRQGDDVTVNARTIRDIPLVLPSEFNGEIRGEVYMSKAVFEELNRIRENEGEELFANPRNAASGTMKQKDSSEVARRKLGFFAYQMFWADAGPGPRTQTELVSMLTCQGFKTPMLDCVELRGDIKTCIDRAQISRTELPYDVDGLVFKVNDIATQHELGIGTRSPKWAVAYKFPAEKKTTVLRSITVQVGRTGTLTPVAELTPVKIAGTTVKRASLCNQDEINRLNINIGDTVIVEKAGEIIPKVVGIASKRVDGAWKMPEFCPCCNTAVKRNEGQVAYYCPNHDCPEQVFERLEHAASKRSLDIDGCGEAQLRALIEHGVKTLSGLLTISNVDFLGDASKAKFLREREKAKQAPLWRKLHALGVEGVGSSSSKELASQFSSLVEMVENPAKLKTVIGQVASQNFIKHIEANVDEIEKLDALGFKFEQDAAALGPLTGKTFVITGAMMSGTRDKVAALIESKGGSVKPSVSRKVNFLVRGEGAGQNKTAAAEKYGTQIISEDDLYKMMGLVMTVDDAVTTEREY